MRKKGNKRMDEKTDSLKSREILAIDIGGSKLLSAVVEVVPEGEFFNASFHSVAHRPLSRDSGQEGVLRALEDAVAETVSRSGRNVRDFEGIGVTIPGLANPVTGEWIYAPFSGIRDFPITSILSEKYSLPVRGENDVNACAWGERIFGACRGIDDFLWVTISNGIGGGLVLGGQIFRGAFGAAAEIGHFHLVDGGAPCGCGHSGCLEAEAAGPAIAKRFARLLADADPDLRRSTEALIAKREFHANNPLLAKQVAELARLGDPIAREVWKITADHLGRALALAANLINPARIVIGGGVSGAFDLLEPELNAKFRREVMTGANRDVQILQTALGYEAGIYGAASLFFTS